jgi:serine/threonine protein kinase
MRVGNYILHEKIGEGAFSEVWKASHHERPGIVVAVCHEAPKTSHS